MTAYEMLISDWSSDVCSSDLHVKARKQLSLLLANAHVDRGANIHGAGSSNLLREYESAYAVLRDLNPFRTVTHHDPSSLPTSLRSEERRVGNEFVSTCRSRWSRYN